MVLTVTGINQYHLNTRGQTLDRFGNLNFQSRWCTEES